MTYKEATTATLSVIVMDRIANVFACRSAQSSIFRLGFSAVTRDTIRRHWLLISDRAVYLQNPDIP
jgi:hypothetical protein